MSFASFLSKYDIAQMNWVTPQEDIDNEKGYFILTMKDDTEKYIYITDEMITILNDGTEDMWDDNKNTDGLTTIHIYEIPINSKFKWDSLKGVWIYKIDKNGTISYKIVSPDYTKLGERIIEKKIITEPDANALYNLRLLESANDDALISARALKILLNQLQVNVVTAESLTAGMIVKTLVDIPGYGATVYGGFSVYDTDAKRKYLSVKTKGVYSHETARQMALGALINSRAMVSIAVTGNAMPYPENKEMLGDVFIGVAIRTKRIAIDTTKVVICSLISNVCKEWKSLNIPEDTRTGVDRKYAAFQYTSLIADFIRYKTVEYACSFAKEMLIKHLLTNKEELDNIDSEDWDKQCKSSWIIEKYNRSVPVTGKDCAATDPTDIENPKDQNQLPNFSALRLPPPHSDITTPRSDITLPGLASSLAPSITTKSDERNASRIGSNIPSGPLANNKTKSRTAASRINRPSKGGMATRQKIYRKRNKTKYYKRQMRQKKYSLRKGKQFYKKL